jgi:hypothetical protein
VGQDNLGPVVVKTSPVPGATNVDSDAEVRITMSETILASTVSKSTLKVEYQPAGAAAATEIPGFFYTDGGNGAGNNFPNIQLDSSGVPGRSGVSPRNGVDIVFRPNLDAFPVNMAAESYRDPFCSLFSDPPFKGNKGYPLGQTIIVRFNPAGTGVTDTAGNQVPAGSPNQSFTFETRRRDPAVFAPNNQGAIYYGDTVGVGVIDVDPARTRYRTGPNPARPANSVVKSPTTGLAVRVPVPDLVDLVSDTRSYTAFYDFVCSSTAFFNFEMPVVYAASGAVGGGQIVVIDSFNMVPMGRFGTPSPGGVALTAIGTGAGNSRLVVSNFSANTVTVYDVANVRWYTGATLVVQQPVLTTNVASGTSKLILSEKDFTAVFPKQKQAVASPPGPPVIGTVSVGVSPTRVKITGFPGSLGSAACGSPSLSQNLIVCALNAGENTADFTELQRLTQSQAIEPDLPGVSLSSQPTDLGWSPWSIGLSTSTGAYYFFITGVGGTVELFSSGFLSSTASVRPGSANNFAPNKIINSVTGLNLPSSVQWITNGTGAFQGNFYTYSALIAETGENRLFEVAVTAEFPTNLFQITSPNLASGLGPVDVAGDPASTASLVPFNGFLQCQPRFTTYYVANAGQGNVSTGSYQGGVIATDISTPGVLMIVSWWSR